MNKNFYSIFKLSTLINILTVLVFFFVSLESLFYFGFTQKHFLINFQVFFITYLGVIFILAIFGKFPISPKIIKINKIILPISLIASIILNRLEQTNYPNFIYSNLHINPNILIYIPFISCLIFYIYSRKFFKETVFYLIVPMVAAHLTQFICFKIKLNPNLLNLNILDFNLPIIKGLIIKYLLWLIILLFFTSLFKKRHQSLIAYFIFFILINTVNRYKIHLLNNFFILNDIRLVKTLITFIPSLIIDINFKIYFFINLIAFISLTIVFKKKFNINNPPKKVRLLFLIISIFVFIFPIFFPNLFNTILNKNKISRHIPDPMDNCKINGILFCFYNDLENVIKTPPKEYTQTKINQIYSDLKELLSSREVPKQSEGNGFIKPNVIIILSESFWDVTNLSKIKYSEDPIKNIRKDIKSSFKSSSFGGGTANIEFELLTGLSNYFLKGTTPYSSQIINRPIPTLFTLFKDQGYLTTVIHPYLSSMYNRRTVYKNFGLDKFISIENLSGYKNIGPYVSDESFNEELIKQLNSVNQSQLIFGISMQNHVVFEPNNYSKNPITFQSPLSSKENSILQSYVNGINLTDQYYSNFKNELNKIKKPTIIILFGDHLTSLGEGFDIYQKSGFDTNNEDKLHSTPIAVWANYPINITLPQNISPSFLSVEILKLANITTKYQFSFLDSLFKEGTTLNTYSENKFSQDQLKNYELIQYDLIFGKQYLLKN